MRAADWYFDFLSPFSYLQLVQFDRLPPDLEITYRPVLFAGLLGHWEHKGPAEIPAKRVHTYRWCHWYAARHGIPFRMPPAHPFNPLRRSGSPSPTMPSLRSYARSSTPYGPKGATSPATTSGRAHRAARHRGRR